MPKHPLSVGSTSFAGFSKFERTKTTKAKKRFSVRYNNRYQRRGDAGCVLRSPQIDFYIHLHASQRQRFNMNGGDANDDHEGDVIPIQIELRFDKHVQRGRLSPLRRSM